MRLQGSVPSPMRRAVALLLGALLFALWLGVPGNGRGFVAAQATPNAGQQPTSFVVTTTLQPIFSPDNALYQLVALINGATRSLQLSNQELFKFSSSQSWLSDGNPIMAATVKAYQRGVTVQVLLAGDGIDTYNAGSFLASIGISAKYLVTANGNNYNHNKGVIVDGTHVCVSSINWSKTALTQNREAGVILFNVPAIASYFATAFNYDWGVATTISATSATIPTFSVPAVTQSVAHASVTGNMTITCFVNPDNGNAYTYVLNQLRATTSSLHAEMYSWNLAASATAVTSIISSHASADVTLLISATRAGSDGTVTQYTTAHNGGANVYLSSSSFTYQHAKFWVIDHHLTTVYTGNWDGTSLTATSASSAPNREWGVTIDSRCIANIFLSVLASDRAIASPPSGFSVPCTSASSYDACGDCANAQTTPVSARCSPGPVFDVCGVCGGSSTLPCTNGFSGSSTAGSGNSDCIPTNTTLCGSAVGLRSPGSGGAVALAASFAAAAAALLLAKLNA